MSEIVQAFLASRDRPEIALKRSATRRPVSAGRYMVETVHVPAVKQANKEMHGLGAALRLSRVLRSFPRKRQSSNLIPGSPLARGRTEKMSIRRRECVQSSFVGSSGQICSDLNLDRRSTNHPHCDFWFVQSECPPGQSYDGLKYSINVAADCAVRLFNSGAPGCNLGIISAVGPNKIVALLREAAKEYGKFHRVE